MSQRSKRFLKYAGITAGAGIAVLGLAAFYFTRPAVQKKYALEILEKQGISAEISHLQAGLGGSIDFSGLSLKLPEGHIQCQSGSMEISPLSLLQKKLVVDSIEISGLSVDLTQKTSTAQKTSTPTSPTTSGKPLDFSVFIRDAALTGNIRTSETENYAFSLKGRRIDSKRGGEIFFTARESSGMQRTVDGNLNISFERPLGKVPASLSDLLEIQPSAGLQTTVADSAGNALSLILESSSSDAGQKWRISIAPRDGSAILRSTGTINASKAVNADLKLNLDTSALGLITNTSKLPAVKLAGNASISGAPGKDCAFRFTFDGNIADFGKIDASLSPLPGLDFHFQGNASGTPRLLDIASFDCTIGPTEKAVFARLQLTRPVKMEKQGSDWHFSAGTDDLIALNLNHLPLTLANAFLPKTAEAWRIENGTISADLLLAANGTDSTRLRTKTPLQLQDFAISSRGSPYVEKIDGKIPLSFNINKSYWELDTNGTNLRAGTRALADISGKVSATQGHLLNFSTTITAHADALAIQPAWSDILKSFTGQDWRARLTATGTASSGIVFQTATLTAAQGENPPLLRGTLLQPFDTANQQASEGRPLLHVETKTFPLALATPFLGGAILGGTASGTVSLTKNPGSIFVETATGTPIILHAVSYTSGASKPLLNNLHLESQAKINASIDGTGVWSVDFSNGKIDAGDGHPLSGSLAISWDGGLKSASADLEGDPTRLLSQPMLGGFDQLASAQLSLKGSYHSRGPCDAKLSLDNIHGKAGQGSIPRITLGATGDLSPQTVALDIPIQLHGKERISDLHVAVTNPPGKKWNIKIQGNSLDVPDITQLVAIFTPSPSKTRPTTPASTNDKPDTTPFWGNVPAEITLDVGKIISPGMLIENTSAHASLAPEHILLNKLGAKIDDGTISGNARLNFNEKDPYDLSGKLSLTQLPFSNVISLFSETSTDCIDGRFDTQIQFSSIAPNCDLLADRLVVNLDFSSRNGRVRMFKMDNDLVRATGELADLAGGVADIVSGLTSNPRTEKLTQPIRSFSKIQKYLADFPYEQSTIQANRTATGDIKITNLFLRNDQLQIKGNGEIHQRPGIAFGDSPLALNAKLDARSDLATGLSDLKLIKGEVREDGYYPGPDFSLSGSFNSIQNNLFSTLLQSAKNLSSQTGIKLDLLVPTTRDDNTDDQKKNPADKAIEAGNNILRGFGF